MDKTAVQILIDYVSVLDTTVINGPAHLKRHVLDKATKLRDTIEKQQIIDAANNWVTADPISGEDYYNNKYKTL